MKWETSEDQKQRKGGRLSVSLAAEWGTGYRVRAEAGRSASRLLQPTREVTMGPRNWKSKRIILLSSAIKDVPRVCQEGNHDIFVDNGVYVHCWNFIRFAS